MTSGSILSRFLTGTLAIGVGKALVSVLGLVGLVIATRLIAPELLGTFVLLQVIVAFLTEISILGFDLSIPRFLMDVDGPLAQRKLINTVIHFRLAAIAVTSLFGLLLKAPLIALFGTPASIDIFVFVPALLALISLERTFTAILQGVLKFKNIALVYLIESACNFGLILLLVVWLDLGVFGLVYARLLALVCANLYAFTAARIRLRLEFEFGLFKRMVVFGLPLEVDHILTFAYDRLDTLIIGALFGPAEIAFYEIARRIPTSLASMYDAFRQVFFPIVAKLSVDGAREKVALVLNNATRLLSFCTTAAAMVAVLFGTEIITLLFSEDYGPSGPVFGVMMVGLSLTMTELTLGYTLVAIGESNKPPIVNFARTLVIFPCYFVLIPALGLVGAALTGLVGTLAAISLDVFFLRRKAIDAQPAAFLKPLAICGVFLLGLNLLAPVDFLPYLAAVPLFIIANVSLNVITLEDWHDVSQEIKPLINKYIKRRRKRPQVQ